MTDIYLHLCSEKNCTFVINNIQVGYVENINQSIDILTDEQFFTLFAYPTNENKNFIYFPFSAQLEFISNKLISKSNNIIIADLGANHYRIEIIPFFILNQSESTPPLHKKTEEIFASLTNKNLILQNKDYFFNYITPCALQDFNLKKISNFYVLYGINYTKQEYLLLLNNKLQFICDCIADKIEFDKNQIITLNYLNDIARHGLVTTYSLKENGFKQNEKYSVYTQNAPITPANIYTIPWAFLQAVNIKNIKLARMYLHSNLSNSLKDEHIISYFGDFVEFFKSPTQNLNVITLSYNSSPRFVKNYCFEVIENKISNIDIIE